MKTVGVTELKGKLSAYLAVVEAGEEVMVTDRGRPVARLVPVDLDRLQEHLVSLVREGIVKLPRDEATATRPRVRDPRGRLLAALFEDRREGP